METCPRCKKETLDSRELAGAKECRRCFSWVQINTQKHSRFTAFLKWPNDWVEEVDIDAVNKQEAKKIAQAVLLADYEPGGQVIEVRGPRYGLYV